MEDVIETRYWGIKTPIKGKVKQELLNEGIAYAVIKSRNCLQEPLIEIPELSEEFLSNYIEDFIKKQAHDELYMVYMTPERYKGSIFSMKSKFINGYNSIMIPFNKYIKRRIKIEGVR